MTIAENSTSYGFGSSYGLNTVSASDRVNFSDNFLTAINDATNYKYSTGEYRPTNFLRSIYFDSPVSGVAMYIADVDSRQGVLLNALDASKNVLSTITFNLLNGNNLLRYASFAGLSGISQIQIIGDDPVGIDNISFIASVPQLVSGSVPEPSVVALLISGLLFLGMSKRKRRLGTS